MDNVQVANLIELFVQEIETVSENVPFVNDSVASLFFCKKTSSLKSPRSPMSEISATSSSQGSLESIPEEPPLCLNISDKRKFSKNTQWNGNNNILEYVNVSMSEELLNKLHASIRNIAGIKVWEKNAKSRKVYEIEINHGLFEKNLDTVCIYASSQGGKKKGDHTKKHVYVLGRERVAHKIGRSWWITCNKKKMTLTEARELEKKKTNSNTSRKSNTSKLRKEQGRANI